MYIYIYTLYVYIYIYTQINSCILHWLLPGLFPHFMLRPHKERFTTGPTFHFNQGVGRCRDFTQSLLVVKFSCDVVKKFGFSMGIRMEFGSLREFEWACMETSWNAMGVSREIFQWHVDGAEWDFINFMVDFFGILHVPWSNSIGLMMFDSPV